MTTRQVNLRLEPELLDSLQQAADAEHLERGTMLRKLLIEALHEWRLQNALRRYQAGEISIGRACEDSGRSHWEILDLIRARGIVQHFGADEALERIRPLLKRSEGRVAEPAAHYPAGPAVGRRAGARRSPRTKRKPSGGGPDEPLPDFAPRPGGVLLVGLNPAPASAGRGHYYQGRLGRRLWKRLERLGLLRGAVPGHEDDAFVAAGHGLTDLVKRVTASASELSREELSEGREALRAKVRAWQPGLVLFVFKLAAVHALGRRDVAPGPCGEIAGSRAYLLTGPYAEAGIAARMDDQLRRLLRAGSPEVPGED